MSSVLQIDDSVHSERMKALIEYTKISFDTEYPSPFGAALYDIASGELLAQAYGSGLAEFDPSNHAEVRVIRDVCKQSKRYSLNGCILYSTCEPCAMCMSTGILAEIDAVVYGASAMGDADKYWNQRSDVTAKELASRIIFGPECVVISGMELASCQALFEESAAVCANNGLMLSPHEK